MSEVGSTNDMLDTFLTEPSISPRRKWDDEYDRKHEADPDPEELYKNAQGVPLKKGWPPDAVASNIACSKCKGEMWYSLNSGKLYCGLCGHKDVPSVALKPKAQRTPVMKFSTHAHAQELLGEWKRRLFLDDWTIHIKLVNECEMESESSAGEVNFVIVNHSASISILEEIDGADDRVSKMPHELTLVHELLHLKYNLIHPVEDAVRIEQAFYDCHEHMLIEQMAKSLIMAKYNLPFEWFDRYG